MALLEVGLDDKYRLDAKRIFLSGTQALVRLLATLRLPGFPVTSDQLLMLQESNTCEVSAFYTAFDLIPLPLRTGLARALRP